MLMVVPQFHTFFCFPPLNKTISFRAQVIVENIVENLDGCRSQKTLKSLDFLANLIRYMNSKGSIITKRNEP